MLRDFTEVGVLPVHWNKYLKGLASPGEALFLTDMLVESKVTIDEKPPAEPDFIIQLKKAPPSDHERLVVDFIQKQAIKILGLDESQSIDLDKPLYELGLDSLLAVELRNVLGTCLGLKGFTPATLLFDYPTINAVAAHLVRDILPKEHGSYTNDDQEIEPTFLTGLELLSEEEAEALLMKELSITLEMKKSE
jgi:acyl carrier protein